MSGRLLGIARHRRPRGAMETLDRVAVTIARGIEGDCRGVLKPTGRNRRQVSVFTIEGWRAALDQLGVAVPWEQRRANLLIEGVDLAETTGLRLRFAGGVGIEIMGECDPCFRMEAVAGGLEAALRPDWRGGVIGRVLAEGMLTVGDAVEIEGR